ncbi:MAG: RNA polymerase sigma factor [Acidobacteria bacterium]|nr:RNA polymerase sigma factor [Acidobacteriota bacterium]
MEATLIERQDWLKELYDKYSKNLWYYILGVVRNEALTDDIFQDTFYRVWRANPSGLLPEQEKAYLFRTATRLTVDYYRKQSVRKKYSLEEDIAGAEEPGYSNSNIGNDLEKVFSHMSEKERSYLWLAYVEGYSHAEIARIFGIKEKSVKIHLFRIREKAKELFNMNLGEKLNEA